MSSFSATAKALIGGETRDTFLWSACRAVTPSVARGPNFRISVGTTA